MAYEQILYRVEERVAVVTLNRPDRLNAWTPVMQAEVKAAMRAASGDPQVRVIVLTGAGRGFCAGADMSALQGIQSGERRERAPEEPCSIDTRIKASSAPIPIFRPCRSRSSRQSTDPAPGSAW